MKKVLSLILVLSMLLSTLSGITVFAGTAQGELKVTVSEVTNNTVTVSVFITKTPGIAGMEFNLDYDTDKVTLVSAVGRKMNLGETDDFGDPITYYNDPQVGTTDGIKYAWANSEECDKVSEEKPILVAKFTLNDGFDKTTFSITNAKFSKADYSLVDFDLVSASLSLPELDDFTFEDDSVTYDGEAHSLYATGVADGATVTYTSADFDADGKAVAAGTYIINATAKKDGYISRTKTATLEILPKELELGIDAGKEYDGTTAFNNNIHIANKEDVVFGDDVALTIVTNPVYESKDASDSIKLINGVYELIGADKDNYEIVGDLTGSILKRPLTIKADDVEIFEGAEVPHVSALTYTIIEGSLVAGETLSGFLKYEGHANNIAGTETQIVDGDIANANPNYEIEVIPGTFSVSEKEAQSITVGTLENATYGETGIIKLAINDTQVGLGDYTVESTHEDVATIAHDGTVTIVGAGSTTFKVTRAGNDKYKNFSVNVPFVVNKRTLFVALATTTINYGETIPELTYSGFVNGDDISALDSEPYAQGFPTVLNADTYPFTITGGHDSNYDFSYANGTLTVKKLSLKIGVNPATITYGDEFVPEFTYRGFLEGEDETSALTRLPQVSGAGTDAGEYEIKATGASAKNYEITYADAAELKINKAPLTIGVNGALITYGDQFVPEFTFDGFAEGEDETVLTAQPQVSGAGTDAGEYEIKATGAEALNYEISYANTVTLTINKKAVTVTANKPADVKIGSSTPELTYTVSPALVPGDSFTGALELAEAIPSELPAGTLYKDIQILQGTLALNDNYELTYVPATLRVVEKDPQVVTFNNTLNATYGDAGVKLSINDQTSALGEFTITSSNQEVATVDNLGNITVLGTGETTLTVSREGTADFADFTGETVLTVNKAQLTIGVNPAAITYGETFVPDFTFNGFVNGEDKAVLTAQPQVSGAGTDAGEYEIKATGASATNYEITYADAVELKINKAPLTIGVNPAAITYGETFTPEITFNGFVNGENKSVLTTPPSVSGAGTDAGTYQISATGATATNYEITYADAATLTINKKAVTVTAIDIDNKTATLEGILEADRAGVELDFDNIKTTVISSEKSTVEQTTTITSTLKVTNFTFKGEKAKNYTADTEASLTTTISSATVTESLTEDENVAIEAAPVDDKTIIVTDVAVTPGADVNKVAIDVTAIADTKVNTVALPITTLGTIIGIDADATLEITLKDGSAENKETTITLNAQALAAIQTAGSAATTLSISVDKTEKEELATEQAAKFDEVSTKTPVVYSLNIVDEAGNSVASSFGDAGIATVKLPYAKPAGNGNVIVKHLDDLGNLTDISNPKYDANSQTVTVELGHFSEYLIYTEPAVLYVGNGGGVVSNYTVKFETNGGSTVKAITVNKNALAAEPAAPTKDGFKFDGWYTDKNLTTAYDFKTKVTKSFTLYAKWTEIEKEPEVVEPDTTITFTDVKENDWFFESVKKAYESGLMKGMTDTEFAPTLSVTRAMFVTVLYRLAGEPVVNFALGFDDVKSEEWYTEAIRWAASENIVLGVTDTEFGVNNEITREQMVTILYRYKKATADSSMPNFKDADNISSYAVDAVNWAVANGVMKGNADNTFAPKNNATRAETAAVFTRLTSIIK